MSHSPEPWKIEPVHETSTAVFIVAADGTPVLDATIDGKHLETARRIAACVNACRGISTEILEKVDPEITRTQREMETHPGQLAGRFAVILQGPTQ